MYCFTYPDFFTYPRGGVDKDVRIIEVLLYCDVNTVLILQSLTDPSSMKWERLEFWDQQSRVRQALMESLDLSSFFHSLSIPPRVWMCWCVFCRVWPHSQGGGEVRVCVCVCVCASTVQWIPSILTYRIYSITSRGFYLFHDFLRPGL